jgi:CshA-type fibril repeat protein
MMKSKLAVAAVFLAVTVFSSVQPAQANTEIFLEDFGPSWVPGSQWALAEGSSFSAQVNTDGAQTPNSALRLTSATQQRAGGLLYRTPVPTEFGLDMAFHFSMWGGNGADGINFFLQRGTETSSRMPPGGTLGYSADRNQSPNLNGLSNGLIGIGFDMFGNHGNASFDGTGCPTSTRPGANALVVRGPGNLMAGYCILSTLKQVNDTTTAVNTKWDHGTSSRAGRARSVRIVLDTATVSPRQLKIWLCASGQVCSTTGTPAVAIDAPAELLASPTVRFGFAASTGGYTNNHEIWGLQIRSQVAVTYSLSYDLGGGTGTVPAAVTGLSTGASNTLAAGTGLSRTGFTFGGWTCDNSIGDKPAGSALTQPAANVVCSAKWIAASSQVAVTYSLSYDLGGGTGTVPAAVTGLSTGASNTLAAGTGLSRTGFTFGGWTCDNSIGDKPAGSALTQPAANVVCSAKWIAASSQASLTSVSASEAKNDSSKGRRGEKKTIEPLKNDVVANSASWASRSMRLCGAQQVAPNCTLTSLTVDGEGTYTVISKNRITFSPISTFTGRTAEVRYQVSDSNANVVSARIGIEVSGGELPRTGRQTESFLLYALSLVLLGALVVNSKFVRLNRK